jgi:cell division protein ZapA (FtsZ GTPase activity inhibitor)
MKQKYTLLIADMEISVITDEPQESVEHIVGILDRKMREITLKSKRCSKNEAALLCALDFCAEKIQMKEKAELVQTKLDDAIADVEKLTEKTEVQKANIDRLERENQKLERELRALRGEEAVEEAPVAEEAPKAAEKPVEEKKNTRNRVGSMFDLLTFSDI